MNEKNSEKLLLDLALHRYDEEVQRNELIDGRNKSIVAFLGVMLTIQCTILPSLVEFKRILSSFQLIILFSLFIISLIFYFSSLLVFMSTLNNINQIQTVPRIDWLVKFGKNNNSFNIVKNVLISLNRCVDENDEILEWKNSKGHIGLSLMKYGIIFTTIFIIYVIIIVN
jgi:hypothetical protein